MYGIPSLVEHTRIRFSNSKDSNILTLLQKFMKFDDIISVDIDGIIKTEDNKKSWNTKYVIYQIVI